MVDEVDDEVVRQMYEAVSEGRTIEARQLLKLYPALRRWGLTLPTWLHEAARYGQTELIKMFIDEGMDVNAGGVRRPDGPLSFTLGKGYLEAAKLLLDRGASPNIGRLLIGAINAKENSFELVKLLVERGADVNQCWRYGEEERFPLFNALSWAIGHDREDIADYLRARGATMPPEESVTQAKNASEEITAYFERQFGPVDRESLQEIVPSSDCPVAIHRIPPNERRNSIILFSTGMSDQAMNVPDGGEEYRFAELMIEIPSGWPLTTQALCDPNNRWPVDWLRKVAAYPRQEKSWLGGPFAIMANSDPASEFSPQYRFTSMLLAAGYEGVGQIVLADRRKVQVYSLIPLYEEERRLEQKHGLPELFRRLDQFNVLRRVDRSRPNVAAAVPPENPIRGE